MIVEHQEGQQIGPKKNQEDAVFQPAREARGGFYAREQQRLSIERNRLLEEIKQLEIVSNSEKYAQTCSDLRAEIGGLEKKLTPQKSVKPAEDTFWLEEMLQIKRSRLAELEHLASQDISARLTTLRQQLREIEATLASDADKGLAA